MMQATGLSYLHQCIVIATNLHGFRLRIRLIFQDVSGPSVVLVGELPCSREFCREFQRFRPSTARRWGPATLGIVAAFQSLSGCHMPISLDLEQGIFCELQAIWQPFVGIWVFEGVDQQGISNTRR